VLEASNANEALSLIHQPIAIDLMLTNVVMPETSGFQLADIARKVRPGLNIVFMSGHLFDAKVPPGLEPIIFLKKPFGPEQLREAVSSGLGMNTQPKIVDEPIG
jgi:YesN/AraC family two-component response regulator